MAQEECNETSSLTTFSSLTPPIRWWPDLHQNHHHTISSSSSISSWTNNNSSTWQNQQNSISPNSSEDVSMSNNTSFSVDQSTRGFIDPPQPPDTDQIWTRILLGVGSNGDHELNEACDYLKKFDANMDTTYEFKNYFNGFNSDHGSENCPDSIQQSERLSNKWPIARPEHHEFNQFDTFNNASLNISDCVNNYDAFAAVNLSVVDNVGYHGYDVKCSRDYGGNGMKFCDVISFNNRFSTKPYMEIQLPKPASSLKSMKMGSCTSSTVNSTSQMAKKQGNRNEGKKKRSEETAGVLQKKPKNEHTSTVSSSIKAPKVKLTDKVTALQQIVSPFGKTDTASVLLEAIQYIKFLQEQVQLFTNPYIKGNCHKDPWGSLDRLENKMDLRSKGLCLVPISCTPRAYHENTSTDYWTPTYRGYLYR